LSTSPGGRGGQSVLELASSQIPRFGGEIRASVALPSFMQNFDTAAGRVSNPEFAAQVEAAIKRLFGA